MLFYLMHMTNFHCRRNSRRWVFLFCSKSIRHSCWHTCCCKGNCTAVERTTNITTRCCLIMEILICIYHIRKMCADQVSCHILGKHRAWMALTLLQLVARTLDWVSCANVDLVCTNLLPSIYIVEAITKGEPLYISIHAYQKESGDELLRWTLNVSCGTSL